MNIKQDETSLLQLEFPKIIENLESLLSTPFGKTKLDEEQLSCDSQLISKKLTEVEQMAGLLASGYHVPMNGFIAIEDHLDKMRPENAFLEPVELLDIKNTLQLMGELSRFFREYDEETPALTSYARGIHYHRDVINEIEGAIDHNGEIFDNASRELREIRIKIRSLEGDSKRVLRKVQKRYAEYSQDEIVTLRDGRMVLGIVPNYVNKINGIVHGTSGSGATIFVEPMETLHISNQIQSLKIQERAEIIKILRFLTGLIRQIRDDIYYGISNVGILDLILAKARFTVEIQANVPKISDRPYVNIANGRHPLLILKMGREQVVPLFIELGEAFNTLVITGPNAGGKTVAMKTVGLCLLMTQMGMPIPADADSEIPLLPNVLVDIGDRQSLEQDLSTFSAHVLRMKEILEQADNNSLVLMDELGTGTDPKEGAALAIALMTEFTKRKALTVATTHHGELKSFAHSRSLVENGSMEFDLDTLQPTYKLRIGVPGSSYGFEIARRYGLPEFLVEQAQMITGEEKDKLEDLILSLEKRSQEHEKERRELSIKISETEAMRNLYERHVKEWKAQKAALEKKAAEEAQKILSEANALIEKTVREIRESDAAKDAIKSARQGIQTRKAEVEKILSAGTEEPVEILPLKRGDTVWVTSLGEEGELLEDINEKNKVRVMVGHVKLMLDAAGLQKLDKTVSSGKPIHHMTGTQVDDLGGGVKPEIDLRGLDTHEAMEETDRYLTQAINSGWEEVCIVHGKGTGALRQAVNQFLARDKRVESRRLGKWGEGDTGVTIVKLRRD